MINHDNGFSKNSDTIDFKDERLQRQAVDYFKEFLNAAARVNQTIYQSNAKELISYFKVGVMSSGPLPSDVEFIVPKQDGMILFKFSKASIDRLNEFLKEKRYAVMMLDLLMRSDSPFFRSDGEDR